ncbi:MAG: SDR family oxidoreductase [Pseudomonadota bacterium]
MAFDPHRRLLLQIGALSLVFSNRLLAQTFDVPKSPFGVRSTAEEVTAGIDLRGKTVLVTGCNSGIGYETMRVLALRGAQVFGTALTKKKGREACSSVTGNAEPFVLELSDFDSVVSCADEIIRTGKSIDVLVCNAGVLLPRRERVKGVEKHFVVNHLGHFLLVNRLMDPLRAAEQGRIVVVSSVAHWSTPPEGIQFDNLSFRGEYDPILAYGQSKLANGLFAKELARRLKGTNVTANALHPGVVDTNLFRHSQARVTGGRGRKTVAQGAATSCYLAAHPSLKGVSGHYFENCNPAKPSPLLENKELAAKLWLVSEQLTADYLTNRVAEK